LQDKVVARARDGNVRLVRFLYCDNGGIIRGKASHVRGLSERLQGGLTLTVAMQAMSGVDRLASVEGLGPVGEVRLVPDQDTFVVLPYAPHTGAMVCDLRTLDGAAWSVCPRSFLKRMEERAAALGLRFYVGFDPEWSLAVPDGNGYRPVDESLCFSSIGMLTTADVIDAIVDAFEKQDVTVEQYYPELGHGQQELSVRYAPALRSADNQILYRETIRGVAHRFGLVASFAPKPWPDQAGNGCHLHVSLWDLAGQRNLFYDAAETYGLSKLGGHFLAGVLEHLPALVGVTCPSVNSYRRLRPQTWASAFTCYGPDNREAAIRIVSPTRGNEASSVRLELKPSDNSANPYLSIGCLLAAGLDGVQRELRPPEDQLVLQDPATLPEPERRRRGIWPLPASLGEALANLERDQVLLDALGPDLARAHLAVRRTEAEYFAAFEPADECRAHFVKY